MSDSYIIEVKSGAAGIIVKEERGGFRFFAANTTFTPLEGQVFRNAREAEKAAGAVALDRGGKVAGDAPKLQGRL
jgi:hypothetical protein